MSETLKDASELLNAAAHEIAEAMDAGAVVILALVLDENGDPVLVVGSTGTTNTTRIIADAMPKIAEQLIEASAEGKRVQKELTIRIADAN